MTPNHPAVKKYTIQLTATQTLGNGYFELSLSRPETFHYCVGQRIRFIEAGLERDYSLISTPSAQGLSIYVRLISHGKFSPRLVQGRLGDAFSFTVPHVHFRFFTSHSKAIFIASGTGLAPFVAFVRSGIKGHILLHGVRDPATLHYHQLFHTAGYRYIVCLDKAIPPNRSGPEIYLGTVGSYLSQCLPKENYDFYVCGSAVLIRDVTHIIDRLFPDSHLFYETFY